MIVVFMGSPQFAVPSLEALLSAGHDVRCVVTQPDRPRARGRRPLPTPVKELAEARGIPALTPESLRSEGALRALRDAAADVIVVVAYGRLLPPQVLSLPALGCINVHASLLPKYRGAAPIERAIMAGERVTGVTTMYMAEGLDTGDVILQEQVPIGDDTTAGELREALAARGAALLLRTLDLVASGAAPRTPQDERAATFAPRVKPEEFAIDWTRPASSIHNLVRAASPKPGAATRTDGRLLKILRGAQIDPSPFRTSASASPPGAILGVGPGGGLVVKTGDGGYLVSELQPEGGRRMSAPEYLRGHPLEPGRVLG